MIRPAAFPPSDGYQPPEDPLLGVWRHIDAVGLGRMVLSYPALPADSLASRPSAREAAVCRTFSDCTTAPRNGLKIGCYPLDAFYKRLPKAAAVKAIKARMDARG